MSLAWRSVERQQKNNNRKLWKCHPRPGMLCIQFFWRKLCFWRNEHFLDSLHGANSCFLHRESQMLWLHRVDPFGRYIFFTIRFCFLFRYRFCLRLHAFKRTRGVTRCKNRFTIEIGPGRPVHMSFQEWTTMMLHHLVRKTDFENAQAFCEV